MSEKHVQSVYLPSRPKIISAFTVSLIEDDNAHRKQCTNGLCTITPQVH